MTRGPGRRYLYLLGDGLHATVIDSQVITVLEHLAARGVVFDLFIYQFQPPRSERSSLAARLAEVRGRLPGQVTLWTWPAPRLLVRPQPDAGSHSRPPTPQSVAGLERRERILGPARRGALLARRLALQAFLLARLAPSILRRETIVVHARGGALDLGLGLKRWYHRFRVLADFRGDTSAEYLYKVVARGFSPQSPLVRREQARLRSLDRRAWRVADAVQCVSERLRRRLEAEHGPRPERVRVVPCVADETRFRPDDLERARRRADLGLTERAVFVYSGSLLAWQQPGALLRIWKHLAARFPSSHLLLLTPETSRAEGLVRQNGLEAGEVSIRSARHQEVASYLAAADVALLLREPHPLNEVASPTKFAEYVLSGLPVMVSRGIGDLDALVESEGLGVMVEDYGDMGEIERKAATALEMSRDGRRAERARRAAQVFGLGAHLESWVETYLGL